MKQGQTMGSVEFIVGLAFCWLAGVGLVYKSWKVWRQTGVNPVVLPRDDSTQGWVGRQFRWVLLATGLLLSVQIGWPMTPLWRWHEGLWPIKALGWLLLVSACVLMPLAQQQMGRAWRVGFDEHERTPLITHGVFAHSRNPVFLALRAALWAWLLLQPTAWSLALCLLADLLMQVQVRLEEAHLTRQHGDTYLQYQRRVRRWI
jgi:protein-S-isoprenylcysteine O-methyltransferase Ste14